MKLFKSLFKETKVSKQEPAAAAPAAKAEPEKAKPAAPAPSAPVSPPPTQKAPAGAPPNDLDAIMSALQQIEEIMDEPGGDAQEPGTGPRVLKLNLRISDMAKIAPQLFDAAGDAFGPEDTAGIVVDDLFNKLARGKVETSVKQFLEDVPEPLIASAAHDTAEEMVSLPLHLVVPAIDPTELKKRTSSVEKDLGLDKIPNLFVSGGAPAPAPTGSVSSPTATPAPPIKPAAPKAEAAPAPAPVAEPAKPAAKPAEPAPSIDEALKADIPPKPAPKPEIPKAAEPPKPAVPPKPVVPPRPAPEAKAPPKPEPKPEIPKAVEPPKPVAPPRPAPEAKVPPRPEPKPEIPKAVEPPKPVAPPSPAPEAKTPPKPAMPPKEIRKPAPPPAAPPLKKPEPQPVEAAAEAAVPPPPIAPSKITDMLFKQIQEAAVPPPPPEPEPEELIKPSTVEKQAVEEKAPAAPARPAPAPTPTPAIAGFGQVPTLMHCGIDLNSASVEDLVMRIEGIGEGMAQRIVHDRTQNGPFYALYDLARVPGIGAKAFEKITLWKWNEDVYGQLGLVNRVLDRWDGGLPDLKGIAVRFAEHTRFEGCVIIHTDGHLLSTSWDPKVSQILEAMGPQITKRVSQYMKNICAGEMLSVTAFMEGRIVAIAQHEDIVFVGIRSPRAFNRRHLQIIHGMAMALGKRFSGMRNA